MAKKKSKNYWIVYENNTSIVKHLTWSEVAKADLRSKFYWEEQHQAENYKTYLDQRRYD